MMKLGEFFNIVVLLRGFLFQSLSNFAWFSLKSFYQSYFNYKYLKSTRYFCLTLCFDIILMIQFLLALNFYNSDGFNLGGKIVVSFRHSI